jgi:hypothetical protein
LNIVNDILPARAKGGLSLVFAPSAKVELII